MAPKVEFPTGNHPRSIVINDVDGDGKLDLIVANYGSNSLSIFRNISEKGSINSNSFAPKVDLASESYPTSIAAGDLDGDGRTDIAVVCASLNIISIYRNTSSYVGANPISFESGVNYRVEDILV